MGRMQRWVIGSAVVVAMAACGDSGGAGMPEAGASDGAVDGGTRDGGTRDARLMDAGIVADGAPSDGSPDGTTDPDATTDASPSSDAGHTDAGGPAFAFVPSNLGTRIDLALARANVTVTNDSHPVWVVDTDDGSIVAYDGLDPASAAAQTIRPAGDGLHEGSGIGFRAVPTAAAPVGAFVSAGLTVEDGAQLIGIGTRPLAWVVTGDMRIDGRVTVGADRLEGMRYPGPGGSRGGSADLAPGEGPGGGRAFAEFRTDGAGGGGGGHGTPGAKGGDTTTEGRIGASGGSTYGDPTLVPLVGGSGGGAGGPPSGLGGHGGGALQLVAFGSITVPTTGVVDASGGGGLGASSRTCTSNDIPCAGGGGGGGSGGAILLEATEVRIDGFVGAAGGAGGQGGVTQSDTTAEGGADGAAGRADRIPAPGTPTSGVGGGGGEGSGGADALPQSGLQGQRNGGGGGGGAGRIRINTALGTETFEVGLHPSSATGLSTVGTVDEP